VTGAGRSSARGHARALGLGLSAALLLVVASARAACGLRLTCAGLQLAELEISLSSDPPDPLPGELVEVDAEITNTSGGSAGIPLFRLVGAEPLFAIEEQENSYPLVEFARYQLRAVRSGQAALQLSVNFETAYGCVDLPVVVFRSASSLPYLITVRGNVATGSATPTSTPTPLRSRATPARISAALPRR